MRWDARTKNILGVCREHGKRYELEFRSMNQAIALRDGIHDGNVHLATEVCVPYDYSFTKTHQFHFVGHGISR
jgi:hypothetical protein